MKRVPALVSHHRAGSGAVRGAVGTAVTELGPSTPSSFLTRIVVGHGRDSGRPGQPAKTYPGRPTDPLDVRGRPAVEPAIVPGHGAFGSSLARW